MATNIQFSLAGDELVKAHSLGKQLGWSADRYIKYVYLTVQRLGLEITNDQLLATERETQRFAKKKVRRVPPLPGMPEIGAWRYQS